MATNTLQIIVFATPVWTDPIPTLNYNVGDMVDFDLYTLLDTDFNGTIARKSGTDQLPPDLSIVNGRYLQGEITEVVDRTFRLIATRHGVQVESPDFQIITMAVVPQYNPLWTNANDVALWQNDSGVPLWER